MSARCFWLVGLLGWVLSCGPSGLDASGSQGPPRGKGDIIGEDERLTEDSREIPAEVRAWARSTAMVISRDRVSSVEGGWGLQGEPYWLTRQMCPDEPFVQDLRTGFCSAWLIAPDVMVTNGHCLKTQRECEQAAFVFDHTGEVERDGMYVVPEASVVGCKHVLVQDETSLCEVDFAVVKLEREVKGRRFFEVGEGEVPARDLAIVGHPLGMPRKYSLRGEIFSVTGNIFSSTHDTFGGNSGSAAFDPETGRVHGMLTCGASRGAMRVPWEGTWSLDQETGRSCEAGCDADQAIGWKESSSACEPGRTLRRCSCVGGRARWERRDCLPFEAGTQGKCDQFIRGDEERVMACGTTFDHGVSTAMCSGGQLIQRASSFSRYARAGWQTFSEQRAREIPAKGSVRTDSLRLPGEGILQGLGVQVSLVRDEVLDQLDVQGGEVLRDQLTLSLVYEGEGGERVIPLEHVKALSGEPLPLRRYDDMVAMPFLVRELEGEPASGSLRLELQNDGVSHVLQGWSISVLTTTEAGFVDAVPCRDQTSCCTPSTCPNHPLFRNTSSPPPKELPRFDFDGERVPVNHPNIVPTASEPSIEAGWAFRMSGTGHSLTRLQENGQMMLVQGPGTLEISREVDFSGGTLVRVEAVLLKDTRLEVWQGIERIGVLDASFQPDKWKVYTETFSIRAGGDDVLAFALKHPVRDEKRVASIREVEVLP